MDQSLAGMIPLAIGFGAGLLLGGVFAGLWITSRLRPQAQRAEAMVDELRRQVEQERGAIASLRHELSDAQQARVTAETRIEDASRQLADQKLLIDHTRQELVGSFQALSGEALKQNNEAFLKLAAVSFESLQIKAEGDLAQRQHAVDALVRPLQESLQRYDEQLRLLEQSRQSAYGGLDQHLKLLAESQQRLQQETGNLVKALRAPTVRGQWGELTLKRVAELAGMVDHCDFVEQLSVTGDEGRFRPDMVVQLPGGRQIIVDAKTVLSAYLDAHEAQDEAQQLEALRRHSAQVKSRMDELSLKAYWTQFDRAPEFVVLFLPGEQFLGAALDHNPRLIEEGFANGIVLATPATLIALLRAVSYGWRQERMTAHAEEAGRLGKELYERMAVLAEHMNDVGQALGKSVSAYNRAVGSLETRILPAARRFKELGVSSDRDIPVLGPTEVVPRKTLPFDIE
ncbi:DNA recombination protein RmuC [Candidatus Nitrospira nitrificans]|uniref:Putative DNA recombination protein RmuC n=1 Tax=Candidatus Nitrospira nitrificans TaxID=1742973 RepID=A0A0S4LCP2_9BACT|nr:DNA recombination protein RmuC [Candidatus Nitrospira nitrificans]CUS35489.1 putative DNA recombination protein RmuC [Candidatus Nitrospira nitrificans]